jgi:mitogen-activated protein kinase kinase kinase
MDAIEGRLIAVRQVELPNGTSEKEERKRDMMTALEREIELWKQLQHKNIVQYIGRLLDSIEYVTRFD